MFFLGLLIGALAVLLVVGWFLIRLDSAPPLSSYQDRASIHHMERQAIHDMVAAEFAARQTGAMPPNEDIIEGTAVEVRRP